MKTMTRRSVLTAAAGAAAALSFGLPRALAQSATPGAAVPSALSSYPVLAVTITDTGYDLSTDAVPAGYVLLTVTNKTSAPTGAAVLGPEAGKTMDDLLIAASTPPAGDGFPAFLYQATILGGPGDVAPGETLDALLTIAEGDWVVFGEGQQPPSHFKAAKSGDSNVTEPKAGVEVTFGDFSFNGLDKLTAGDSLWKITNKGVQPHMMAISQVPDGATEDQVMATIMSEGSATPAAGAISPDQLKDSKNGVLLLSSMQTMWLPVTFEKGSYVALCFVGDVATGEPHAMEGMVKLFTVS